MVKITRRDEKDTQQQPVAQDPVRSLRGVHEAMDRIFGEALSPFRRFGLDTMEGFDALTPRVDISETENEVKVRAEVPGVDPKDVNVEVTEDSLSISGSTDRSVEEKQENYYRMERNIGSFSREFMLPSKIDADSVKAEARNGVIAITLNKLPSEQKKRVEINSS